MTLFRKKPRQRLEGVVTLDYLAPRRSPRTEVFVVGGAGVGGGSMEGARGRDNYPRCLPRPDWSTVRCFPWFVLHLGRCCFLDVREILGGDRPEMKGVGETVRGRLWKRFGGTLVRTPPLPPFTVGFCIILRSVANGVGSVSFDNSVWKRGGVLVKRVVLSFGRQWADYEPTEDSSIAWSERHLET